MSYEGPGIYRHYKGGLYRVWGVGGTEAGDQRYVVYTSLSAQHELARLDRGVDFILRPLKSIDGIDAFDAKAGIARSNRGLYEKHVERFVKVQPNEEEPSDSVAPETRPELTTNEPLATISGDYHERRIERAKRVQLPEPPEAA